MFLEGCIQITWQRLGFGANFGRDSASLSPSSFCVRIGNTHTDRLAPMTSDHQEHLP